MSRKIPKHARQAGTNASKTNTPHSTANNSSSAPVTIVSKPTQIISKPAPIVSKPAPAVSKPMPVVPKPAVLVQTKPAPTKVIAKVAAKPSVTSKPTTTSKPKVMAKKEVKKDVKKVKPEKIKMERDSFTMPKEEYAQITLMKARLTALGQPAKKSELLRAGIKLLAAMSDNTLKTTLAKIPVIKTGRPNKKG
ncbi:MAG: hypothetical protein WBL28_11310 [Methylotenera sp.]